jgi:signal transduction histidine kinase
VTRGRLLAAVAALALGLAFADAARRAPAFSLAGDSVGRVVLGVAAGWGLVAAGLALGSGAVAGGAGARQTGRLLVVAGLAWLASGLATPGARGAALFTLGLVVVAAAPALIGHAVLTPAGDGLRTRLVRVPAAWLYASLVGVIGVLPTLMFDPAATGCASCPANLIEIADAPGAAEDVSRWGIRFGLAAVVVTLALATWGLARATSAGRLRAAPVVVPAGAYLALVASALGHSWERGFLGVDDFDRALWAAQAVTLLLLPAGVALLHVAARRRRARMARLVVELGESRRPRGLRDALAGLLGDPDLELLFPGPGGDIWIDVTGSLRAPPQGMATTPLVRDGEPVALLCHRAGVFDDPRLAAEIERTVRLGLEHERLRAELSRQLAHLRRSRADVAAAGEAERRLLERDLHDGAQQRLVAFAFALGVARQHAPPASAAAIEGAHHEVNEALAELRDVAHGLYPVALAEAGLAAAIESLGDRRPGLRAAGVPSERFAPAVEEAAYLTVASLADQWSPKRVALTASRGDGRLVLELTADARPPEDVVGIEDRVGALGGTLSVTGRPPGQTRVRVELPCG